MGMKKCGLFAVAPLFVMAAVFPVQAGEAAQIITIGIPKAPPALPILRMIDSEAMRGRADIKINVWAAPEQLIAMVQDGGHQMFAFPLTVAAKLHNKGVGIKLTNINTWGVTYFVTSDPAVKEWRDLKGKTLFVPLKSSTPDALTQYFLGQAGLKPGRDLDIVYSSMAEIGQLLRAGKIEHGILLEPQVTAAIAGNPALRVAFSFEDEWKKIKGAASIIPNAGIGATTNFLETNRELALEFEKEYEKAVQWIHDNPEEAGKLAETYIGLRAETIAAAIPRLGLRYKSAQDAAGEVEDLYTLLFDFSPDMIGKRIPDATLYWK